MLPDVAILTFGSRTAGEKGERTQGSLLSRDPNSFLPWFPSTLRLQRDLQENRHTLPRLCHRSIATGNTVTLQ